jgi:hypothetical protein
MGEAQVGALRARGGLRLARGTRRAGAQRDRAGRDLLTPSVTLLATIACALVPALPGPAHAREGDPEPRGSWQPPHPEEDEWDWVRAKSGEWLKGDLERLRRESLEFDSDEFGQVALDWEDVAELRSPRAYYWAFEGREVLQGPARMRDGVIKVRTADGVQERWSQDLVSIVTGGEREIDYWDGKLSLGFTQRSGNTNQTELSGFATLRRSSPFTRFRVDYVGSIGTIEGTQNVNNHRATSSIDVFLANRFYLTPLSIDAFSDPFENTQLRLTPSAGGGYEVIDSSTILFEVELTAGAQYTKFDSTTATGETDRTRFSINPRIRLELEPHDRIEFDATYLLQLPVPQIEEAVHHTFAVLSFEITSILDIDFSFVWDRNESPEREANGNTPERDDFRTTIGIGIEF